MCIVLKCTLMYNRHAIDWGPLLYGLLLSFAVAVLSHNNSSFQLVNMSKALESATPVVTALISHQLMFSPLYTRCLVTVLTGLYIHINVIVCGLLRFKNHLRLICLSMTSPVHMTADSLLRPPEWKPWCGTAQNGPSLWEVILNTTSWPCHPNVHIWFVLTHCTGHTSSALTLGEVKSLTGLLHVN